jgi:hypothetical protein
VFYTHNLISEFPVTGCPEIKMRNILKNRTALSTVVTTLIILVVSVLLAGVVTYFAINVTSTRVQEESLHLTKQHIWYSVSNNTQGAEAGLVITNTGGRDVVLDKVAVRGQNCLWDNIYYNATTTPPTVDLNWENHTTSFDSHASGNLVLKSGNSIVLYIMQPDSVTVNDVGLTVAISVFSAQATYYKETNVEAA